MTNEEMQNTMEFILQQQAQFAVNIQRLEGTQERTAKELSELATRQAEMLQAQAQMYQSQNHMNNVVAEMADAQARTDERMVETDERLNNLINIVERYISERRNGDREG
jgi:hypothetical protein